MDVLITAGTITLLAFYFEGKELKMENVEKNRLGAVLDRVQELMGTRTDERDYLCHNCSAEIGLEEIIAGADRLEQTGLPGVLVKHLSPCCPGCVDMLLDHDIAGLAIIELFTVAMQKACEGEKVLLTYGMDGQNQRLAVFPTKEILTSDIRRKIHAAGSSLLSLERVY